MQKNNFKQDRKSPASNQSLKNKEIKGAGAETYPTGQAAKGGAGVKQPEAQPPLKEGQRFQQPDRKIEGGQDLAEGAQDDSTKSFAADSKSRGSKLEDVQSQPSTRGSQNSRH